MALEYEEHSKFEKLAPVLEDYADWFGLVAVCVAYYDQDVTPAAADVQVPTSFKIWLDEAQESEDLNPAVAQEIKTVHDDMVKMSTDVLGIVGSGQKPNMDYFIEFKNLYNAFLLRIRRFEKDNALDSSGMDEKTGLRNAKTIESDVKREMERLERQGNPFSLVMCRVDRFVGQPSQDEALKLAVNGVKHCMRSFDDAYYMHNGVFLLSLKHADIIGAEAAVTRIQNFLLTNEDNQHSMTMSYCLVEPSSGDDIKDLLKRVQNDLADHLNETDAVLKFVEMSELQRYVGTLQ